MGFFPWLRGGFRSDGIGGRFRTPALLKFDPSRTPRPKRKRMKMRHLPLWHVIFFIYFLLIVRLMAMADMGVGAYAHRIDELAEGNLLERSAAKVMWMDPISRALATDLRAAIKSWAAYTEPE